MIESLRATALDVATQLPLEVVGPIVGLAVLFAARRYLGRWPDPWRIRRLALPILGRFKDNPNVPDKTTLPLQREEFVGVVDAPPADVRAFFRDQDDWWPAVFASIQYDVQNGEKVYEVGSYARRPDGFTGMWQDHVRLTPRDDGGKTALWAHHERSPIASPKKHYNGVGWTSAPGVKQTAETVISESNFAFTPSTRATRLRE